MARGPVTVVLAVVLAVVSAAVGCALASVAAGLDADLSPVLVVGAPLAVLLGAWAVRRPLVAAALVPLTMPFGFVPVGGGLLQLGQAVLLLVVGAVVLHRALSGQGLLPRPAGTGWLLTLLALIVVAVPGSADMGVAVNQTIGVLLCGVALLALAGACRGMRDVRRMVGLLLLGGGAVCATGFFQISDVGGTGTIVSGATGIFSEHNQFGVFAATVGLLALAMLFAARSRWARLATLLVLAVALGAEALALSRGAYLGTALGLVVFLVLVPEARRQVAATAAAGLAAAGLFVALAPDDHLLDLVGKRLASFTNATANPSDDRPAIWAEALRQIQLHPLTGSGPANFPIIASQTDSQVSYFVPAHAHDVLLTVAAEIGLPAVAVLVVLTLVWTRVAVRTARAAATTPDRAVVAGLAAALACFAGAGIFDATPRASLVLAMMCTCTGLLLAAAESLRAPEQPGPHPNG
jgi:O-antigen ligase